MTSAVVFAYSEVGYRCLKALLAQGIEVPFVVTHSPDPNEHQWFGSVETLAQERDIEAIKPDDANEKMTVDRVRATSPDFIFSFYYRHLLCDPILHVARLGALNVHGSLLPKYRGRAPVNWAIVNGESETGASLHYMLAKPDAGALVGQQAVEIGINDTAFDVSLKVAHVAEQLIDRYLPQLISGCAPRVPLELSKGSYFGRRTPADGEIFWDRTSRQIHDLIRAVAPPFPGAFAHIRGETMRLLGSYFAGELAAFPDLAPCLYFENSHPYIDCVDGLRIQLTSAEIQGFPITERALWRHFGATPVRLTSSTSIRDQQL
jgi:methionyl-tRNA formyltransferase